MVYALCESIKNSIKRARHELYHLIYTCIVGRLFSLFHALASITLLYIFGCSRRLSSHSSFSLSHPLAVVIAVIFLALISCKTLQLRRVESSLPSPELLVFLAEPRGLCIIVLRCALRAARKLWDEKKCAKESISDVFVRNKEEDRLICFQRGCTLARMIYSCVAI